MCSIENILDVSKTTDVPDLSPWSAQLVLCGKKRSIMDHFMLALRNVYGTPVESLEVADHLEVNGNIFTKAQARAYFTVLWLLYLSLHPSYEAYINHFDDFKDDISVDQPHSTQYVFRWILDSGSGFIEDTLSNFIRRLCK